MEMNALVKPLSFISVLVVKANATVSFKYAPQLMNGNVFDF